MKLNVLVPSVGLPLPGLRAMALSTFYPGEGSLRDWRVHVRGPAVFLVSPEGWQNGKPPSGNARVVYEIPRSLCFLGWIMEPEDKLEGCANHTPPPPTVVPDVVGDVPAVIGVIDEATPNQVDGPARADPTPPAVLPADPGMEEFDGEDLPRSAAPAKGKRRP